MYADLKKVLLIEDEVETTKSLNDALLETGALVITAASDAESALKHLNETEFALVITSFKFPNLEKTDGVKKIRETAKNANTPIIIQAGMFDKADKVFEKAGLNQDLHFVSKPCEPPEMVALCRKVLRIPEPVQPNTKKLSVDVNLLNPFLNAVLLTMTEMAKASNLEPQTKFLLKKGQKLGYIITGRITTKSAGFTGTLYMSFPQNTFLKVMSGMLEEEFTEVSSEIEDGAAEFANVVLGQAKRELNQKGYQFETQVANYVKGEDEKVYHATENPILVIPFKSSVGDFFVQIGFES